jgi:hypothetical protein
MGGSKSPLPPLDPHLTYNRIIILRDTNLTYGLTVVTILSGFDASVVLAHTVYFEQMFTNSVQLIEVQIRYTVEIVCNGHQGTSTYRS